MKTLIVFLGIAVLHMALLTWQSDCTKFSLAKAEMDRMAKECAAGAVLYFKEEAYAEGNIVIDEEAVRQFTADYNADWPSAGGLADGQVKIKWHVENRQAQAESRTVGRAATRAGPGKTAQSEVKDSGQERQSASVTVETSYQGEDFFRLPFLKKDAVKVYAAYETVGR